jgi:hypothetical protein
MAAQKRGLILYFSIWWILPFFAKVEILNVSNWFTGKLAPHFFERLAGFSMSA